MAVCNATAHSATGGSAASAGHGPSAVVHDFSGGLRWGEELGGVAGSGGGGVDIRREKIMSEAGVGQAGSADGSGRGSVGGGGVGGGVSTPPCRSNRSHLSLSASIAPAPPFLGTSRPLRILLANDNTFFLSMLQVV